MKRHVEVMISSTARDLPEYREAVKEACLRMGMFPVMMEHLPASDQEAVTVSLKMVDESDIYLGIFGHRYGYVPQGYDVSITEMEYNRGIERAIPRLIFVVEENFPLPYADADTGGAAEHLHRIRSRLLTEAVVNFFTTAEDLRGKVIHSLVPYRQADVTILHNVSAVPLPPEPYVAHPYTLLQTERLVGRQAELNRLTAWVAPSSTSMRRASILTLIAIGGMGKSALTWQWFNSIAPVAIRPLVGRMWWSFYESDATFENFVCRALAYASRQNIENVQSMPYAEREAQLIAILEQQPFLIVLDGIERTLRAFASESFSHTLEDSAAAEFPTLQNDKQDMSNRHDQMHSRQTADPRMGRFLRKLATVSASRILISSRIPIADLQTVTGEDLPGCSSLELRGLTDDDALSLWHSLGLTGSRDKLISVFSRLDNYPLLINTFAGVVARDRRAAGDLDIWLQAHPSDSPLSTDLAMVKAQVMAYAFGGLNERGKRLLQTIAAFRMPAMYDTLVALAVGDGKLLPTEAALDAELTELENRGLVGWDRRANRYDMHPIVREVAWLQLSDTEKRDTFDLLARHFKSLQTIPISNVTSVDQLTSVIELYNSLVGLQRYDEAWQVYDGRMRGPLYYNLGEYRTDLQLLESIPRLPDGLPLLTNVRDQTWSLLYAAMCCERLGEPESSVRKSVQAINLNRSSGHNADLAAALVQNSMVSCDRGYLRQASDAIEEAVALLDVVGDQNWRGIAHRCFSRVQVLLGNVNGAHQQFAAAGAAYGSSSTFVHGRSTLLLHQAQLSLLLGDLSSALEAVNKAIQLSRQGSLAREGIKALWQLGNILTAQAVHEQQSRTHLLSRAESVLSDALVRARAVNLMELESEILLAQGRWYRAQSRLSEALTCVAEARESAVRHGYALVEADTWNTSAQIAADMGDKDTAGKHAERAFRLSWRDSPPYAYHWGLDTARAILASLNIPPPVMP